MTTLVKLQISKRNLHDKDKRYTQTDYCSSAPFFENPNGQLIHRVKYLYKLEVNYSKEPWLIIEYWCANVGRTDIDDSGLLFDPGSKLVCARCESMALAKGEKTSSQLAKRHICIGVCRPVNTCILHRTK